jgi:nitrogen fixation/metabolism regulation signal transduction histidine kinase
VVHPLPETLVSSVGALTRSHRLVQSVRHERGKVVRTLVLTFLAVYGGILVLVLGLGVVVASRVTRPVAALGRGIEEVAAGNLNTRVPRVAGGAIGHLLDGFNAMVSRLREQQSELARLERLSAWRQMARRLAHEVKNPLTPIQLAAQEMRDAYPGGDDDYRALLGEGTSIIEEEVASLRTLVAEFSEFARMPAPKRGPMSVAELLEDIGALYRDDVRVAELPRATIHADREQLHRALVNLVNNALDAERGAGVSEPVTVDAAIDADTIRIRVLDRGPGVPVELRRRIFEPDVTSKSDGMGLGLAIVESTITAHGGTIAVTDREGGGAAFEIRLPISGGSR